jgi:ribonuclease Z
MGLNGHRDPVRLVGPRGLRKWLAVLRDLSILRPAFRLDVAEENTGVVAEWDDFSIEACPLDHRIPTGGYLFREHDLPGRFDVEKARELGVPAGPDFGRLQRGQTVVLESGRAIAPEQVMGPSRQGRRIAWITDTRPSDRVIDFVRGADVLVHEATYLDALRDSAHERGHTTVRQAAEVAAAAGVKHLVLTHISPKHTRNRELLDEARPIFADTSVAEDGFEMTLDVPA